MGLQKPLPIYTEPLSKGEKGTILRLMGNNGEISEVLFLESLKIEINHRNVSTSLL